MKTQHYEPAVSPLIPKDAYRALCRRAGLMPLPRERPRRQSYARRMDAPVKQGERSQGNR